MEHEFEPSNTTIVLPGRHSQALADLDRMYVPPSCLFVKGEYILSFFKLRTDVLSNTAIPGHQPQALAAPVTDHEQDGNPVSRGRQRARTPHSGSRSYSGIEGNIYIYIKMDIYCT